MEYLFAFLIAFLVSFFVTPWCISIAKKFGFVDQPNRPHPAILHKKIIPRGGGLPVLIAFLISIFVVIFLSSQLSMTKALTGILVASVFLVGLGLAADK